MIRICFVKHNDENKNIIIIIMIIIIPGTFRHFLSMCMSRWRQHLQHSLQQLRPRCRGSPRRAPAAGCVSRIAAAVAICRACASDRASGSATAQRSRGATRRGGAGRERNTPWLALEVASGINGCLDVSGLGKGLVDRLTMMNETIE